MAFNPLKEKGISVEKQIHDWSELTALQYNKYEVDPYTRCRIILMNGIEVGAALFKHEVNRMVDDLDLKRDIAMSRRAEQQQQKMVSGMVPGNETTLEHTIGYEQVAVDVTAWCAQHEPDDYVRQAFDFALLEDFDHLYRYSEALDFLGGDMEPEEVVGGYTEIMPGRPTVAEHRHPFDDVRRPIDIASADPITLMNIMTLTLSEQQTMNFYMNVANRAKSRILRGLYAEIGQIEEQHVTHYGSLMDPHCSWLMCSVLHELHECWLYHSMMEEEVDSRIRKVWEMNLDMEIGHLHRAIELYEKHEKKDPEEFLPEEMPEPFVFESNIEYVREVLEDQIDLTTDLTEYVAVRDLPRRHRYFKYNSAVNGEAKGKKMVPSQMIVEKLISEKGEDYRCEAAPHPVERFRDQTVAEEA
jgi:rubrerythrin